jgi:hypothetical protein
MSAAPRRPGDFSPGGYRALLRRALDAGYRVTCFRDFAPPDGGAPVLLLRHDLDHSLCSAAVLAGIEAELGVRATYFVQVACPFYNLLSDESRGLVRHIVDLGHEIGLHYDGGRYTRPGGGEEVRRDLELLGHLAGAAVISASQHIPIDSPGLDLRGVVPHEAYAPRFTQAPMTYVSDSLMAWRQWHPLDLVEDGRSLQLLTHPVQWAQPVRDMDHALRLACEAECAALRAAYGKVREHYARLLRDRPRLDAAFHARRAAGGAARDPS